VNTSSDVVVLTYQSTGVDDLSFSSTTDIQFPVYAEDAMENYIRWKIAEYDGLPQVECAKRKRYYDDAVLVMRNVTNPTLQEIRDIWAGSSNQTMIK
jgi:hypothetical protein